MLDTRPQATAAQERDMAFHLHGQSHVAAGERVPPVVVVRGDGMHVWDESGRRYLDAMAGVGNGTLGYGEPRLIEAALRQLRRLPFQHTFGNRTTEPVAELAHRLVALAPCPMAKAFFAGSGSEANDTAVMLAWHYWHALGRPERRKMLSVQRGYHGSTVATASLSSQATRHAFGLPLPGFLQLTCPDFYREGRPGETEEAFSRRLAAELEHLLAREGPDTVAAFFLEPVMGVGGIVVPPVGYVECVQAVLRRHGVLLVADEVVCGFGRTGRFWGCESVGLQPDLLVCSKGLTAGYMPMAAVLLSAPLCDALRKSPGFGHGFTQGGNPVAAAVALEVMDIYRERRLLEHVQSVGARLGAALRALQPHPLVGQVRGIGMMWAVELVADKAARRSFDAACAVGDRVARHAEAHGVIVRAVGDCLVTVPPLVAQACDIDRIADTLRAAIDEAALALHGSTRSGRGNSEPALDHTGAPAGS